MEVEATGGETGLIAAALTAPLPTIGGPFRQMRRSRRRTFATWLPTTGAAARRQRRTERVDGVAEMLGEIRGAADERIGQESRAAAEAIASDVVHVPPRTDVERRRLGRLRLIEPGVQDVVDTGRELVGLLTRDQRSTRSLQLAVLALGMLGETEPHHVAAEPVDADPQVAKMDPQLAVRGASVALLLLHQQEVHVEVGVEAERVDRDRLDPARLDQWFGFGHALGHVGLLLDAPHDRPNLRLEQRRGVVVPVLLGQCFVASLGDVAEEQRTRKGRGERGLARVVDYEIVGNEVVEWRRHLDVVRVMFADRLDRRNDVVDRDMTTNSRATVW